MLGRLYHDLRTNIRDVRTLGWSFPRRHIAAALKNPEVTVHLKGGKELCFRVKDSDTELIRQIFTHRAYDLSATAHYSSIRRCYDDFIARGFVPVIIDAGANIGASAVWFANQFPLAHVMAIEPEPANARLCRMNLELCPNARLLEGAIGASSGSVSLINPNGEAVAFRTVRQEASGGIRVYTVPEILSEVLNGHLFIVKIDIEGFENDLFASNTEWVRNTKVVIVEPHDWMLPGQRTSQSFRKTLGGLDFEVLLRGENLIYINNELTPGN